ncbi:MAG: SoxR reducing system RseC family protein [Oscillospiraceae bacterium]
MTQIATVKRLVGEKRAEVVVHRLSACGHDCASCGGCGPDSAARVTAVADNEPGARPGDTVRVESESGRVLGMAAALYLVPLVLLFVGYFVASGAFKLSEGASMAVGVACLAIGFAANFLLDRRTRKRPVQYRIVEVLKSCSDM